jgi:hypothetical protein
VTADPLVSTPDLGALAALAFRSKYKLSLVSLSLIDKNDDSTLGFQVEKELLSTAIIFSRLEIGSLRWSSMSSN